MPGETVKIFAGGTLRGSVEFTTAPKPRYTAEEIEEAWRTYEQFKNQVNRAGRTSQEIVPFSGSRSVESELFREIEEAVGRKSSSTSFSSSQSAIEREIEEAAKAYQGVKR